jgi:hypothetical protein
MNRHVYLNNLLRFGLSGFQTPAEAGVFIYVHAGREAHPISSAVFLLID